MFNKDNFTTRHVVKIRDGRIFMISEWDNGDMVLVSKYYITNLYTGSGISHISDYDKNLKVKSENTQYEIMAVKEYRSTADVIRVIINEEEITDWDWVREEKSSEQIEKEQIMEEMEKLKQRLEKLKTF